MNSSTATSNKERFRETTLTVIRLFSIFLIIYWCYKILSPFIPLIVWGAIIAIALYPLQLKLSAGLGNRPKLSATLITILGVLILTLPTIMLTESLVNSSIDMAQDISEGRVELPPPPAEIQKWPVIGGKIHSTWMQFSANFVQAAGQFAPQLQLIGKTLLATAGGAGKAFLQLFFSMIIAGVFLATPVGSTKQLRSVVNWLVGERGPETLALSEATVRSVAIGVVGVAILETIVVALGLVVADMPAKGLWTLVILVFSVVQIPPLLPLIPLVIYAFLASTPVGAIVLLICTILTVLIDTFVKPILLGRRADAPMLVVLMGAIGGMILAGVVGLFAGAVILVLGWELLRFGLNQGEMFTTEDSGQE